MRAFLIFSLLITSTVLSIPALAEDGVTDTEIRIGVSVDQSGTLKNLGLAIGDGALAFFDKLNKAGGINGRQVKIILKDDKYQPTVAIENTTALVEKEKVFALFGNVGSANIKAILPYIDHTQVPLIFPMSGADSVRRPVRKLVFALRADYQIETETLIEYVIKQKHIKDIGVIAQDDALGAAGVAGTAKALSAYNLKIHSKAEFSKTKADVKTAVDEIRKAKPSALLLQTPTDRAIEIIKLLRTGDYKPLILMSSAVGVGLAINALGKDADNILASEVMPLITDNSYPVVKEYRDDLAASGRKNSNSFGLESYVAAKLFAEGLKRTGKDLTREGLVKTFESMKDFDIGGIKASFSPTDHQALHQAYLFMLQNGEAKLVSAK